MSKVEIDLRGKTALVGGGSQGIGQGIAHALAEQGAQVIVMARREAVLQQVVEALPCAAGQQHSYMLASADRAAMQQALTAQLQFYQRIDIVVNNSGGPKPGPIIDASEEDFLTALTEHLLLNQWLAQQVMPGMRANGYGRIINITSTSVKTPLPNLGVSNVVRAAVASWAKTLANEVARDGITVNTLLPGFIETPRIDNLATKTAERVGCDEQQVREQWLASIPVGHFGQPADMASIACFLASPLASYINGIVVPVDGGRTPSL